MPNNVKQVFLMSQLDKIHSHGVCQSKLQLP